MNGNGKNIVTPGKVDVKVTDHSGRIKKLETQILRLLREFMQFRYMSEFKISHMVIHHQGKHAVVLSLRYGPELFYLQPIVQKYADKVKSKNPNKDISGFELEVSTALYKMADMIDETTINLRIPLLLADIEKIYARPEQFKVYVLRIVNLILSVISGYRVVKKKNDEDGNDTEVKDMNG